MLVERFFSQSSFQTTAYNTATGEIYGAIETPFVRGLAMIEALPFIHAMTAPKAKAFAKEFRRFGHEGTGWHFFETPDLLPPDLDTTAIIAICLFAAGECDVARVTDMIMANYDEKAGLFYTYAADETGNRRNQVFDDIVNINVARFLIMTRQGGPELDSVLEHLSHFTPRQKACPYYGDPIVKAWFYGKLIRLLQDEGVSLNPKFEGQFQLWQRPDQSAFLPLYHATALDLDCDASVIFGGDSDLSSQFTAQQAALSPLFRNRRSPIGYACPDFLRLVQIKNECLAHAQKDFTAQQACEGPEALILVS